MDMQRHEFMRAYTCQAYNSVFIAVLYLDDRSAIRLFFVSFGRIIVCYDYDGYLSDRRLSLCQEDLGCIFVFRCFVDYGIVPVFSFLSV